MLCLRVDYGHRSSRDNVYRYKELDFVDGRMVRLLILSVLTSHCLSQKYNARQWHLHGHLLRGHEDRTLLAKLGLPLLLLLMPYYVFHVVWYRFLYPKFLP